MDRQCQFTHVQQTAWLNTSAEAVTERAWALASLESKSWRSIKGTGINHSENVLHCHSGEMMFLAITISRLKTPLPFSEYRFVSLVENLHPLLTRLDLKKVLEQLQRRHRGRGPTQSPLALQFPGALFIQQVQWVHLTSKANGLQGRGPLLEICLLSTRSPLCHEDERSALLQFKHGFDIKKFASGNPSAYPKVESWKLDGNASDCGSWDGVECDHDTGRVIGLDLRSSFLHGSINSNSRLFSLVHLRRLNLADNHFNYSQIPTRIGNLSRLRSLQLYNSCFSGQIPSEISLLSRLTFLDLSGFFDPYSPELLLKLGKPSMRDLVQNLTHLKVLDLSGVNVSSTIPGALSNMTSLTSLHLQSCLLYGEFPMGIFHLPNLRRLDLKLNENLIGYLPEFPHGSPLEVLIISYTSFSGVLPTSIGNPDSLIVLELDFCNLYGTLPPSLGNLAQLTSLCVSGNNFWGQIPSSIANLSKLTELGLGGGAFDAGTLSFLFGKLSKLTALYFIGTTLNNVLPQSLANLTQLSVLVLSNNELLGEIPSWLLNLTQLTYLDFSENQLSGMFPRSISQLKHLESLDLSSNNLSGKVELDIFQNLQNLVVLRLSGNILTVLATNSTNATLPKFIRLGLASCGLKEFPDFLRFQDKLEGLNLADNGLHGKIPTWMWSTSKETMTHINLHGNFLTGFEEHPYAIPWISLESLDFSFNKLQGPLPLPPPSVLTHRVAGNLLTGEVPTSFCQNRALFALDLSDNYLSGAIPQCLASSSSNSLLLLNLSSNNFHGTVPHMSMREIRMIDLSQNQLHGVVPRSLANCTMLEVLVLGDNQINDTFPFWLGTLPDLQVLILRSNRFHGAIENPKTNLKFPKLRIIDLSHNGFSGTLPSEYFQNWNAMKLVTKENPAYMHVYKPLFVIVKNVIYRWRFTYSVTISIKRTKRFYEKIQSVFVAVDLSNNKFSGEIPKSLGSLGGLQALNISNNNLTGTIPSFLANLMDLESLDLSQNLLSGHIPQQLTKLTFLSVLDVSHNRLTGPIPRGKQFDTFDNSSYGGNMGLCGVPLTMLCGNSETSPPPPPRHSSQGDGSEFSRGIYWMVIMMGYGSGLIVGLVIGHTLTTRYHERFVAIFERAMKTPKRPKRKGRRN
ncbi:receptor-like protein 7 [Rhododendron vialii]|uniref:receptor-like protein 7 n=1 Tax=Rhododendron vialii TaxID=182163 RepID=UPI00265EC32A|nr:receptor-like protein 7 [Rhododendron vialii]